MKTKIKGQSLFNQLINAPVGYQSRWVVANHADTNGCFDEYFRTSDFSMAVTMFHGVPEYRFADEDPDYWWGYRHSIYKAAGIPTNYFEYTPYRHLSGLGPLTNDPSVGHPHGYTNAYTAAGGDDLPGDREIWYTTDYGWDGLKRLFDLLIWSHYDNWDSVGSRSDWDNNAANRAWGGSLFVQTNFTETWAEARDDTEASWTTTGFDPLQKYTHATRTFYWNIDAKGGDQRAYCGIQEAAATNFYHEIDFYTAGGYRHIAPPSAPDGFEWEDYGVGIYTDRWTQLDTDAGTTWTNYTAYFLDDDFPDWCAEPGINEAKFKGFYADWLQAVVKWDTGENGFQYVSTLLGQPLD